MLYFLRVQVVQLVQLFYIVESTKKNNNLIVYTKKNQWLNKCKRAALPALPALFLFFFVFFFTRYK